MPGAQAGFCPDASPGAPHSCMPSQGRGAEPERGQSSRLRAGSANSQCCRVSDPLCWSSLGVGLPLTVVEASWQKHGLHCGVQA